MEGHRNADVVAPTDYHCVKPAPSLTQKHMYWSNRSPRVYRFLEKQYVEAFFRTGALRLSSFARFSKHTDEQRLDGNEGTVSIVYSPPGGSGKTVLLEAG